MFSRKKERALDGRVKTVLESARIAEKNFNHAALGFLLTELDAAVTFSKVCQLASGSSFDLAKIDRDVQHIELALKCVMQARERVKLKTHERKKFREKLQELEVLVMLLSERVPNATMKSIKKHLTCLRTWNRS